MPRRARSPSSRSETRNSRVADAHPPARIFPRERPFMSSVPAGPLSSTHWGSFRATVRDGKISDLSPFEGDSNPSDILRSIAPAVDHRLRVGEPYVREGYLDPRTRSDTSRRG